MTRLLILFLMFSCLCPHFVLGQNVDPSVFKSDKNPNEDKSNSREKMKDFLVPDTNRPNKLGVDVTGASGVKEFPESKFWLKGSAGYCLSLLDDMQKASKDFNAVMPTLGWDRVLSSVQIGAIPLGTEVGISLDPLSGLSIGFEYIAGQSFSSKAEATGYPPAIQEFDPKVYPVSLNYYRYFPSGNSRFFLKASVGYYFCTVDALENWSNFYANGQMSGSNIGGVLGGGKEWLITNEFGLELSLDARYARIGKVAGVIDNSLNLKDPLSIGFSPSGTLFIYNERTQHPPIASFDFSGLEINASFTYYFL